MFKATVVTDSGKGFYWLEQDVSHSRIFLHQREVVDERYLHPGDRIEFDLAPNPTKPGKMWAVNAKWIGLTVSRQISAPVAGGSNE